MTNQDYGWGLWLLVEDEELNSIMKHPTHITIMFNMTYSDAFKLYMSLSHLCGTKHIALCNDKCEEFEGTGYSEDDDYPCCSGYYCIIEMWYIIEKFCKNRLKYDSSIGSFSEKPHITYCYSKCKDDIQYVDLKDKKYLNCKLFIADMRNPYPEQWNVK
jgi:hypothetical protein